MLTEDLRARLQQEIQPQLDEGESTFVPCTLKRPGSLGADGLLGLSSRRLVFAHQDFVQGLVTTAWERSALEELRVDDGFLGREVVAGSSAGELRIKCRRAEELETLEAALERLGWFGPAPAAAPAGAPEEPGSPAEPEPVTPPTPAAPVAPPEAPAPPAPPPSEPAPAVGLVLEERVEEDDAAWFEGDGLLFVQDEPTPAPSPPPQSPPTPRQETMACPGCRKENPTHFHYCLACGARLVQGPALHVVHGPSEGTAFPVGREAIIGRVAGNDIHLPSSQLSRRHARVFLEGRDWMVVDLASSNGTRLNGRTITGPQVLKDGDRIGLGDCELQFAEGLGEAALPVADPLVSGLDEPAGAQGQLVVVIGVAVAMFVAGLLAYLLVSVG